MVRKLSCFRCLEDDHVLTSFSPASIFFIIRPLLYGLGISYVKLRLIELKSFFFLFFHFILAMSRRRVIGNRLMFKSVHAPNFHIEGCWWKVTGLPVSKALVWCFLSNRLIEFLIPCAWPLLEEQFIRNDKKKLLMDTQKLKEYVDNSYLV